MLIIFVKKAILMYVTKAGTRNKHGFFILTLVTSLGSEYGIGAGRVCGDFHLEFTHAAPVVDHTTGQSRLNKTEFTMLQPCGFLRSSTVLRIWNYPVDSSHDFPKD